MRKSDRPHALAGQWVEGTGERILLEAVMNMKIQETSILSEHTRQTRGHRFETRSPEVEPD